MGLPIISFKYKKFMSEAIILPQFPPDLSGYSLTTHTHSLLSLGAAAASHSHSGYASSSHSHSGYATQTWVTQNFAPKGSGGGTTGGDSGTVGGMGTHTFSWNSPSVTLKCTPTINWYSGSPYQYTLAYVHLSPTKIEIPSAVSSLTISWSSIGFQWTNCSNTYRWCSYQTDPEYSPTAGDVVLAPIIHLVESPVTSQKIISNTTANIASIGGTQVVMLNHNSPNVNYNVCTANPAMASTAASTYTYPAANIATIAGKTMYLALTCGIATIRWCGTDAYGTVGREVSAALERSVTAKITNTVNFTVRIA